MATIWYIYLIGLDTHFVWNIFDWSNAFGGRWLAKPFVRRWLVYNFSREKSIQKIK